MNQRCRLKNADFVLVGSGDFSRVGAAVESRDADVVVNGAGNNLYTFECTRENYDVTTCCVCLKKPKEIPFLILTFVILGRRWMIMMIVNKSENVSRCLQIIALLHNNRERELRLSRNKRRKIAKILDKEKNI